VAQGAGPEFKPQYWKKKISSTIDDTTVEKEWGPIIVSFLNISHLFIYLHGKLYKIITNSKHKGINLWVSIQS
jgi:hypothetical protein